MLWDCLGSLLGLVIWDSKTTVNPLVFMSSAIFSAAVPTSPVWTSAERQRVLWAEHAYHTQKDLYLVLPHSSTSKLGAIKCIE